MRIETDRYQISIEETGEGGPGGYESVYLTSEGFPAAQELYDILEGFDGKLEFDIKVIPYEGNTDWVERTILDAIKCLKADEMPESGEDCDYCKYRHAVRQFEK